MMIQFGGNPNFIFFVVKLRSTKAILKKFQALSKKGISSNYFLLLLEFTF